MVLKYLIIVLISAFSTNITLRAFDICQENQSMNVATLPSSIYVNLNILCTPDLHRREHQLSFYYTVHT